MSCLYGASRGFWTPVFCFSWHADGRVRWQFWGCRPREVHFSELSMKVSLEIISTLEQIL